MPDNGHYRTLIIDNDDDLLIRLQILLEDQGFETTTAWGGREALRMLGAPEFDVILLGDYLPDVGSRELGKLIRKLPPKAEVAIIQSRGLTEDVRALLRDYEKHCVLPRSTPLVIAEAVVRCFRHEPTATVPRTALTIGRHAEDSAV